MMPTINPAWLRSRATALWIVLMSAVMTACSVNPPMPQDHYYRLPPPHTGEPPDHALVAGTIGVAPIIARGLYQERAVLYTDSGSPLELHLYNYHFWVQSPTHLIQGHLMDYLRAARVADKVTRDEPGETTAGTVSGNIERFERVIGGGQDRVTVALDLRYTGPDRLAAPVLDRTYRATVPVANRTMEAVITAFGSALDQACRAFVRDLNQAARKGAL